VLTPRFSKAFRRDLRRAEKRGMDLEKVRQAIALLVSGSDLPAQLKDHALKGEWLGFRDVHLEPDWIVIYRVFGDRVEFERTGTHADLFRE
jgi:mRNA interferase YafQ